MFKKTWDLFDQMFETFDAEMAEAFKASDQKASDGQIEEVREEETRTDGTRVVRVTKRRLMRSR